VKPGIKGWAQVKLFPTVPTSRTRSGSSNTTLLHSLFSLVLDASIVLKDDSHHAFGKGDEGEMPLIGYLKRLWVICVSMASV